MVENMESEDGELKRKLSRSHPYQTAEVQQGC